MVCSKCGQALKEGAKFCTKCGTSFKELLNLKKVNLVLPIISIVISIIGIIGNLISGLLIKNFVFQNIFYILPCIGIIVALIAQKKQNSTIGFIAGIIPCIILLIIDLLWIIISLTY